MAKQRMKFTIKEIADLILSLNPALYYAYEEGVEDNVTYNICDYIGVHPCSKGEKFKMKITKNDVSLFYFPNLYCKYTFPNTEEFNEITSLFYDFKTKYEDFAYECLSSLIVKQSDHKNPYMTFAEFAANVAEQPDDLPHFVENEEFHFDLNDRPRRNIRRNDVRVEPAGAPGFIPE